MDEHILYRGPQRIIEVAVLADRSAPAAEFLLALSDGDKAKMYALFKRLGDIGLINNKEKFKKIEGTNFYEFKSFQIRMPCFFEPGKRVIVTHGFRKQGDKIPRSEIERAIRIREQRVEMRGDAT